MISVVMRLKSAKWVSVHVGISDGPGNWEACGRQFHKNRFFGEFCVSLVMRNGCASRSYFTRITDKVQNSPPTQCGCECEN